MPDEPMWTVSQLAKELGTTPRAIRFYEEKGLLSPRRSSSDYRVYSKRDRTRLSLILKGKRFGLSLEEIADILGLSSTDMHEVEQIEKALAYCERVQSDLKDRMKELRSVQQEVATHIRNMRGRLIELAEGDSQATPY
jgi:DNA-binding transcriptional MerR regulator